MNKFYLLTLKLSYIASLATVLFSLNVSASEKPELHLQVGHTAVVHSVAFSPDGKTLASGSWDKTIKLWETGTGKVLQTLNGHSSLVNSVAFSPDGKILISGSYNRTIKMWNLTTGKLQRTLKGHSARINKVTFSPDGKIMASGSNDKTIKLWDASTGKLLRTLKGHSDFIESVAFSPDGKIIASGSNDKTVKLWDGSTGKLLRTLKGHSSFVISVAFSPDGKILASGSNDKTIKLWDASTGKLLRTLKGYSSFVISVAFSPDGKILAAGSDDNTIKLWKTDTGELLRTLKGHSARINSVAFRPDGKALATGSNDKTIKLWETGTGKLQRTLKGHSARINSVAFRSDGKILAAGSDDNTIKLWKIDTGVLLRMLKGHSSFVQSIAFSHDGKTLASGSYDKTIKLWESNSGKLLRTLKGHSDFIESVAFSSDGKTLASASSDKTIKLWNSTTGKLQRTLKGHSARIHSVAFSPDGKIIASGSNDKTVKLWDGSTGKLLRTLKGHSARINSVAFSPDGKTLASGSWDNKIKLWNWTTGKALQTLRRNYLVVSVAFSPDGKTLASGGWTSTIELWDRATGNIKKTIKGGTDANNSIAFSPDSKTLVAGNGDSSIRFWHAATGEPLISMYGFDTGDYVTHSPQGYFAASKDGGKYVSWRINNKLFSFDQYAKSFQRPDLIERILNPQKNQPAIPKPEITLDKDLPPTLVWKNKQNKADQKNVQIVLAFAGSSTFRQLDFFFNNQPRPIHLSQDHKTKKDLEIPITVVLKNGKNVFWAKAMDRKTLFSTWVSGEIIFSTPGSEIFQVQFENNIPLGLNSTDHLVINGKEVQVSAINPGGQSIRFLGKNIFEEGINWISNKKREFIFYREENKLKRFENPYKKSYAIIVAIDDYERKLNTGLKPTDYDPVQMIASAKKLSRVLQTLGFPKDNIFSLYNDQATSTAINDLLYEFWKGGMYENADRLFFYFGGHGDIADKTGYLVTYDYDQRKPTRTSLLMRDLTGRHFDNIKAKHMLVTLDSCSSGMAIPGMLNKEIDAERLKNLQKLSIIRGETSEPARNILVAGTGDQRALWLKNGALFTRALLEGLQKKADSNEDKIIQFEELALHVKNNVRAMADSFGHDQRPAQFQHTKYGKGNFIFIRQSSN